MNRKLLAGATAAAAALALAVVGGTLAAGVDDTDIANNSLRVGVLQLDLSGGSAGATLSFPGMMPGSTSRRAFWLVANDTSSITAGTVDIDFGHVTDRAGACTSRDKALAEAAAGVGGCTVSGNAVSGTPLRGNLSRELSADVRYGRAIGSGACSRATPTTALWSHARPGNMRAAGRHVLRTASGVPLTLRPGQGLCVVVVLNWPVVGRGTSNSQRPADDAAEGDSMTMRVRFDLDQVHI